MKRMYLQRLLRLCMHQVFALYLLLLQAEVSNNNVAINTCYQPRESTVVNVYIFVGIAILLWFAYSHRKCCRGYRTMKLN